ncbi:MAG: ligand-binding sensor domain-containing protein [Pyrinomonadaceae bacterium]
MDRTRPAAFHRRRKNKRRQTPMNQPDFKFHISNFKLIRLFSFLLAAGFIFFSILFSVAAQTPENSPTVKPPEIQPAQNFHQWGAVTLFNGLPSDNVRAIAQTNDGVLWFGTDNGLARFDGRRVSTAAINDAGVIFALETSADGILWIGAEKGAFFFDGVNFRLVEETKNIHVTSILISDKIRFSTGEGVIFAVTRDEKTGSLTTERIPGETLRGSDGQPLKITSLAQTGDRLIAGTRSRSILLIENNRAFETFSRPRPYFINVLAQDKQGNVWLGADADASASGFFSLENAARPVRVGAKLGNVSAIEPDGGGAWVGTEKNGLFYFRGKTQLEHYTFENTAGGLRSKTIYAVFIDRENVVWTGTNRGVSRFDRASPFNRTLSDSGNSNFVRTLFRAGGGEIYAGTNRGLFLLSEDRWLETGNFSQKTIYIIGEDSAKRLLIGTPNGLFDYDGKQIMTGDTRAAANFRGKTYAAVFGRGVVRIDNQSQIFSNDSPTALYADAEKLWIGTAKDGVFAFDGKETAQEKPLENLRGAAIRKIAGGVDNDLWFGGERGLFRYKNGQLENIIADQDVRDIRVIGADIRAATLKDGLFHIKYDANFGWLSANLNVEQGLPSEQIFSILPIENRLLIGTNRGTVNYEPGAAAPKIMATRVLSRRLHDAEELNGVINLDYPQNSLLVEVAGLSSRTFPEQFQYGFTFANSTGEIIEKKLSNEAQFTPANLPNGEYVIEARAFNKDLLASEPLIIRFSVARAPFPRTATALGVLLIIALIALIWAMVERRRIKQKNRELARARFDLANEAERERKRIAQDLHDQTLADLRALMMMSDELPAETGEFRREIESVSTEIRRICEDLSPSVLENVGLAAALEFLVSHTTKNYKFSAADNLEEHLKFSPNVQMQIYRIAQEVLTNIKRHSDAKSVEMEIDILAEKEFVLIITDDGTTFNLNAVTPKGRGIANIKSRAALIDAEIFWETREIGGTVFKLKAKVRA